MSYASPLFPPDGSTGLWRPKERGRVPSPRPTAGRVRSLDPIEKKPLFHYRPGTLVHSFGTFGCNLDCDNCQN